MAKQCLRYLAGTKQLGLLYHHWFTSVLGGVFYSCIRLPRGLQGLVQLEDEDEKHDQYIEFWFNAFRNVEEYKI